jgi:hypothetical protein
MVLVNFGIILVNIKMYAKIATFILLNLLVLGIELDSRFYIGKNIVRVASLNQNISQYWPAIIILLQILIVIVFAMGLKINRFWKLLKQNYQNENGRYTNKPRILWYSVIPLCFVFLNFKKAVLGFNPINPVINNDWDSINIATWKGFKEIGLSAGKDFYYPYGNLIVLEDGYIGTILGMIIFFLVIFLFGYFIDYKLEKLKVLDRKRLQLILTFQAPFLLVDFNNGNLRYLLPIFAILLSINSFRLDRIPFYLTNSLSLICVGLGTESSLYLVIVIISFTLLVFFSKKDVIKNDILVLNAILLSFLIINIILEKTPVDSLKDSAGYFAGLVSPFAIPNFTINQLLIIILPFLVIIIAMWILFQNQNQTIQIDSYFLISIFLINTYILSVEYKNYLQSGGMFYTLGLMVMFSLIILIFYIFLFLKNNFMQRAVTSILLIQTLLIIKAVNFVPTITESISFLPKFAFQTIKTVSENPDTLIESKIQRTFSRTTILKDSSIDLLESKIFIFGDYPTNLSGLYLINENKPPKFKLNLWNRTIEDQKRIVEWLQLYKPYVIIPRDSESFMGVQNVVLNSIIAKYIYHNYELFDISGNLIYLQPLDINKKGTVKLEGVFPTTINLGYIPNSIGFRTFGNLDKSEYIEIICPDKSKAPFEREFQLEEFTIKFTHIGDRILIPLNLLYFETQSKNSVKCL